MKKKVFAAVCFAAGSICFSTVLVMAYGDTGGYGASGTYNDFRFTEVPWEGIFWGSFLFAAIVTMVIIRRKIKKHKNIKVRDKAVDYVVPGSVKITKSQDHFLYKTVTKVRINHNSNMHGVGMNRRPAGGGMNRGPHGGPGGRPPGGHGGGGRGR